MWTELIAPIAAIINKLIPDKAAAAAATAQLQMLATQGQLEQELAQLQAVTTAQSDINKVEAANTKIFVSGWRPAIGWICGTGLGVQYLVAPLATWGASLAGHPLAFPALDTSTLMPLVTALLGLGSLRSWEKTKGVASK
jgi:hypothetical protein